MREKVKVSLHARFSREFDARAGKHKTLRADVREAISYFTRGEPLPATWGDHAAHSGWGGCREFHLQGSPDTLIIYIRTENHVVFLAFGGHQPLFRQARPARPTKREAQRERRQARQRRERARRGLWDKFWDWMNQ